MENRDKIFDNNFDSPDFEIIPNFSFNLDPSWTDSKSEEEKIHYQLISTTIHELVINSRFKKFNEIDEHGRNTKLKKVEVRSWAPVMLISTPRAPRRLISSSSGLAMAFSAA